MTTFIKIAWRNVMRSRNRSLITVLAIAMGLGALIFAHAFINGGDCQMIENYTDLISAHIQIHRQDFHKKMGLERSISDWRGIAKVLESDGDVKSFTRRIKDYVLVSSAEQSSGVLLIGIDPVREKEVSILNERVRDGVFLSEGRDDNIILGKDLVDILNVRLGEKVVVMGQGADGSLAAGAYRLCGILDTGAEEIDKGVALITLRAAQDLLTLGDKISEIAVKTTNAYNVNKIAEGLKKRLDTAVFEVLSWQEIEPTLLQWLEFDRAFIKILRLVILLVAAAGILNTILMGVLERIREFGIMLALGTKRGQVVLTVGLESLFLGLMGVIIGGTGGAIVALFFAKTGVDLSSFSTAFEAYYIGSVIYPRLFVNDIVVSSIIVLVTSVAVSIYPAWKAAKLNPIEAIRHF